MKSSTRSNSKYERLGIWTIQFGGATKKATCPACLQTTIELDKYKGWEAAHIMAHARGNTCEVYNMFPLCAICNKRMGTQNMFCFFLETHNKHALRELIKYVKNTVKVHYPSLYQQCEGQIWDIAHRLFKEKRHYDGGIPEKHALWKFFMREDIKENNSQVVEANQILQKRKRLADKINEKYSKMYLPHKNNGAHIVLPTLTKRNKTASH